MSNDLILHWPPAADDSCAYAVVTPGGEPERQGRVAVSELATLTAGRRCRVLVPGGEVLVARVHLPTRKAARVRQALPFALEERLASDIEDLHFAVGRIEADGHVQAAAVEHAVLRGWLEALAACGVEPDSVIPENGVVPPETAEWRVLADAERALLVLGDGALLLEAGMAATVLEGALTNEAARPERVRVAAPESGTTALRAVCAAAGVEVAVEATAAPLFPRLAAELNPRAALDLLQGPCARRARWGWVWRPLRPAAALLGVWLLAQLTLEAVEMQRLGAEREALYDEIEAVYRETFPEGRVVNPRVQMERHLEALRGDDDGGSALATLLAGAGPELARDSIHLRALRYRDRALEVELDAIDIDTLESVRAAIESEGRLAVEIRSASSRDGRVEGRLSISEGAG